MRRRQAGCASRLTYRQSKPGAFFMRGRQRRKLHGHLDAAPSKAII